MGKSGMYARVEDASEGRDSLALPLASQKQRLTRRSLLGVQILLFIGAVTFFVMLYKSFAFGAVVGCVGGAVASSSKTSSNNHVPQYFQTKPELFAGQHIHQTSLDFMLIHRRPNSNWRCSILSTNQPCSLRGHILYP